MPQLFYVITFQKRENSGWLKILCSLSGKMKDVILEIMPIRKKKCVLKVNTTLKILTHGAYETMRGWSLGSI